MKRLKILNCRNNQTVLTANQGKALESDLFKFNLNVIPYVVPMMTDTFGFHWVRPSLNSTILGAVAAAKGLNRKCHERDRKREVFSSIFYCLYPAHL